MPLDKLKTLKEKLERYYNRLEKKYPMTKLLIEAIDSILSMNAPDDFIESWYNRAKAFIQEIEKEIENIEKAKDRKIDLTQIKELKRKIEANQKYLQERLSYTKIISDSLNILVSNRASETMIKIWISKVEPEIEEILLLLEKIENK